MCGDSESITADQGEGCGSSAEAQSGDSKMAKAAGQPDTERQYLRKCVGVGLKEYDEYAMAVFLLRQMGDRL